VDEDRESVGVANYKKYEGMNYDSEREIPLIPRVKSSTSSAGKSSCEMCSKSSNQSSDCNGSPAVFWDAALNRLGKGRGNFWSEFARGLLAERTEP
jgi:hypothetical protein